MCVISNYSAVGGGEASAAAVLLWITRVIHSPRRARLSEPKGPA